MNTKCDEIDDGQLRVLLLEQEDSLETVKVLRHVESCETCQIRLVALVNEGSIESEASELLSDYQSTERKLAPVAVADPAMIEDVDGEFDKVALEPPTHPEMLGRIGRYEIERRIGSGGMGVVFKAIDTELNRPVAIKVLAPHLARNGAARQRFSRESRAAAAVVHEHVVAIHNVDSNAQHPYLVMQFVSGESLQARVDREGPLDVERILRIGIQAAMGLSAAHQQGIVHRDIKPANILLEDGVDRLLITDFGLARTVDDASLTHTGVVAGTPNYMSPEQASGDAVDHRTDLFSLGSVLYFVATGHPPFRAERAMGVLHRICRERHRSVRQVNAAVPEVLSSLIDRLLEKRPAKRFADAQAVSEALTRILQQRQNQQPGLLQRLGTWSNQHHRLAYTALVVAIAAGLVGWFKLTPEWQTNGADARIPSQPRNAELDIRPSVSAATVEPRVDSPPQPSAILPSMQSDASASGNVDAVSVIAADRIEFDRLVRLIETSLHQLDSMDASHERDSSGEFQAELKSLEQKLKSIDPLNK